ncbi:MAG: DinB family protein [Segetibacter sp.]|nr:DinB family protein [Segetibacter sp.]
MELLLIRRGGCVTHFFIQQQIRKYFMDTYYLEHDLRIFGVQVKTFPNGIKEAFDELIKKLPPADERPYYGISECTKEGIIYIAAAPETFEGEGEKYGYEKFIVEKGEHLTVTVFDWLKKTHCIKNVFEEMFTDIRADRTKPCIEIYKNDKEMVCMVKTVEAKV